jgi:hypothetical protein
VEDIFKTIDVAYLQSQIPKEKRKTNRHPLPCPH